MRSITSITILITICVLEIARCQNELFKINKLNLVWSKAQHSLGATKLEDLKRDLSKHELDELTLKKMKAHNQDKEGLFEATVRKRLRLIMTKYSIERYHDDIHPTIDSKNLKSENINLSKTNILSDDLGALKTTFRDKKLDKLWKKAEQSGFTQEQLMILHDEFQDQQNKLDTHYDTMNLIEEKVETKSKEVLSRENSIDSPPPESSENTQESSSTKKARLEQNVQQHLKENYKGIERDIDLLHKKIATGKVDGQQGPFEEAPVNNLWNAAKQSNFTVRELESLKEELEHYETRIKKLKHFAIQLERESIKSRDLSLEDKDDDEQKHIKKRVKELTYKVDKTHKDLERKITSRRDEL